MRWLALLSATWIAVTAHSQDAAGDADGPAAMAEETYLIKQVEDRRWAARILVFSEGHINDPAHERLDFNDRREAWWCTILTTNADKYGYPTCKGLLERRVSGLTLNTSGPTSAFSWTYYDPNTGHFTPFYVEEVSRDVQDPMVAAFRAQYAIPSDRYEAVLIGLDGGVKARWDFPPTPEDVFTAIDAMPMRQRELRDMNAQGRPPPSP